MDPVVAELVGLINRAYARGKASSAVFGRGRSTPPRPTCSRGATTMRLELFVPRTGTHPDKERLHEWYLAAVPGDILVFEKPLR